MYPKLFYLGSTAIHPYGLFIALGLVSSFATGLALFKKHGFPFEEGLRSGLFMLVGTIVGARLIYVSIHWARFSSGSSSLWNISDGGMVFWGGITGCILALWLYAGFKGSYFWRLGDLWAPAATVGITIGWIGCLLAGCCYGLPSSGSIAITFHNPNSLAPLEQPLYPTQLYYITAELGILCVLFWLRKRKKFEGQIMLWYLILQANTSLFVERYRGDFRGQVLGIDMSPGQFLATLILVLAVIALLIRARTKIPRSTPTN